MSPELKKFLTEWYEWATTGADENHPMFHRGIGLCVMAEQVSSTIRRELQGIFLSERSPSQDPQYPFGGRRQFDMDTFENRMHLNPQRLLWVKGKIS